MSTLQNFLKILVPHQPNIPNKHSALIIYQHTYFQQQYFPQKIKSYFTKMGLDFWTTLNELLHQSLFFVYPNMLL